MTDGLVQKRVALVIVALAVIAAAACDSDNGKPAVAQANTRDSVHPLDRKPLSFGGPTPLSEFASFGTAPMFASSPAGREALAWVSAPQGGNDTRLYISVDGARPAILKDPLGPVQARGESPPQVAVSNDGTVHVLYVVTKTVAGRPFPATALRYIRSTDAGKTWSDALNIADDSVFGSHQFQALIAGPDGTLYASWLDGRSGHSGVYVATSVDSGHHWSTNIRPDTAQACPCCRTSMAAAQDGSVYLSWRSIGVGNVREIVLSRSVDKGATWGAPVRVQRDGWVFDGCPEAGPSVAVGQNGRLHVAWWSGKDGTSGVFYANSDDHGATFNEAIPLSVGGYSRPSHVRLVLTGFNTVIALWDDGTTQAPQIVLKQSMDGGRSFGDMLTLSPPERAAQFPVVTLTPSGLAVAWTESAVDSASTAVRSHNDIKEASRSMAGNAVGKSQVVVRRQL